MNVSSFGVRKSRSSHDGVQHAGICTFWPCWCKLWSLVYLMPEMNWLDFEGHGSKSRCRKVRCEKIGTPYVLNSLKYCNHIWSQHQVLD